MIEPDYKSIFTSLPGLYAVLDPSFNIIEVTEPYLEATRTSDQNILGKNIFQVFPDNPRLKQADGAANLRSSLESVLKNKKTASLSMQRYDVRDPENPQAFVRKYWNARFLPVLQKGEVQYIIISVDDVTSYVDLQEKDKRHTVEKTVLLSNVDKIQRELASRSFEIETTNNQLRMALDKLTEKSAELERSNTELASFAMVASHDIKAPFRIVGRYLEYLQEKLSASGNKDFEEYFEKIFQARERIAHLLDDLLNFAMVSMPDERSRKVPMKEVLSYALENLEVNIAEREAKVDFPENLPVVHGERSALVHLLQNLVGNALKFNQGTPKIKINYVLRGEDHLFSVSDNGIGIQKEYYSHIFEVFKRLHSTDEFPGTGLGLSICKRVVERHGGQIWLESETRKGTTFFFTLPVSETRI